MIPLPSPDTRLLVLLGDPVSHSLSPRFQNAALRARGLDAVYLALRCARESLPGLLRGIAGAGGGGNVTVPHKELAARVVDDGTDAVRATGACNTFWAEDGAVRGDNTDVDGVSAAVLSLLGERPAGARVLLLGAGGAARAAVYALARDGAEEIVLLNRSAERAERLAAWAAEIGSPLRRVVSADELPGERFDLALNATSLGLRDGDALPLPADARVALGAALDLVYRPDGDTRWVEALRAREIRARDGREMLLWQGVSAFRRWWPGEPPIEAMRAALDARSAYDGR